MNPQMQNYRQFAQAQGRNQTPRRPGECDPSTENIPVDPALVPGAPDYNPWRPLTDEDHLPTRLLTSPGPQRQVPAANFPETFNPSTALLAQITGILESINSQDSDLGPMPPNQQHPQQPQAQIYQQQVHHRNALLEHQMAQRRARKPTNLNLPDGLEDIVIGDGVEQYKKLRDAEKRLDNLMLRKRLEIQDSFSRNIRRQKTMRIWITNTVSGQPWEGDQDAATFSFETTTDPKFKVRVEGRLLEYDDDDILHSDDEEEGEDDQDEEMTDGPAEVPKPKSAPKPRKLIKPSRKFSHFFKALDVEFENPNGVPVIPGDHNKTVSWKKGTDASQAGEFDYMQFERMADENTNITICLTRDEQPERYRLSEALADTLCMQEADRAEVVMALWDYVRFMGLQEDEERRIIRCDDDLKRIFGVDTFYFPQAAERLLPHLLPLPPVRLPYTIRVDQAFHQSGNPEPTIYDVQVTVEDPVRALYFKMTQRPDHIATLQQIRKLDDELAVVIQAIHHHKARYDFFSSMAKDPKKFMERWLSSQKRDLSVFMGEMERGDVAGMEFAGADVWNSEAVKEAVRYRLARAQAEDR